MAIVGPLSPYVNPVILLNAPTGISWNTIPPGSNVTPAQRAAEQLNICMRATAQADAFCNQPLRATMDTEYLSGPDFRVTIQQATGNARCILQRWPVLAITQIQVSSNAVFPRQWTTLPTGAWDVEYPIMGLTGTSSPSAGGEGGQTILIAPGYVDWANGRRGYRIAVQYVNGWPHTSLTANAAAGATTISVDDCTGWATTTAAGTGAMGTVYDDGTQEVITVTASSVTSGPGTLTLSAPLTYPHTSGVLVSSLPASVIWAVTLMASAQALTRGATATSVHTIPGAGAGMPALKGPEDLIGEAELLLYPYRRTI